MPLAAPADAQNIVPVVIDISSSVRSGPISSTPIPFHSPSVISTTFAPSSPRNDRLWIPVPPSSASQALLRASPMLALVSPSMVFTPLLPRSRSRRGFAGAAEEDDDDEDEGGGGGVDSSANILPASI